MTAITHAYVSICQNCGKTHAMCIDEGKKSPVTRKFVTDLLGENWGRVERVTIETAREMFEPDCLPNLQPRLFE